VDVELFRPLDRAACRKQFGFSGFTVGYIGRFVERKGIQDLIAALPRCPAEVNAVLVGSGEYEPAIRQQIAALGLQERVRIIPEVAPAALTPIMNAIDALALPSRTVPTWKEQFGRVIIEAHACGTPVLGSNSGAIPEVVGEGGMVFPENDVPALAAAITQMASDPPLARHMGAIGENQVHEKYTWQKVAQAMYTLCLAVGKSPRQDAHSQ
jgi:glycosyltransferase involved in cell wall biosynthesis